MRKRDVGTIGEDDFAALCSKAGFTANPSTRDMYGWDFTVEGVREQNADIPEDLDDRKLDCSIQVKSTDKRPGSWQIKLSHLKEFAMSARPSFICVQEYDGKESPQSIYLLHIDKTLTKKILHKIRKLDNQGKGNRLNNHHMSLKYGESERLPEPTASQLNNALWRVIPEGQKKYSKEKLEYAEKVGFEDGSTKISVNLSGVDPIGEMHSFFLGKSDSILADRIVARNQRFGELSPTPFINEANVKIRTNNDTNDRKCIALFKESSLSHPIEISASLRNSPLNSVLGFKESESLLTSPFFELLISPRKGQINFKFEMNPDSIQSLTHLSQFLKLIQLLDKNVPIFLELNFGDATEFKTTLNVPETEFDLRQFDRLHTAVQSLVSTCKLLDLDLATQTASVSEIIAYQENTKTLLKLLEQPIQEVTFRAEISKEMRAKVTIEKYAILTYAQTKIGQKSLTIFLAYSGALNQDVGYFYDFECQEKEIKAPLVFNDLDQEIGTELTDKFLEFEQHYINKGYQTIKVMISE